MSSISQRGTWAITKLSTIVRVVRTRVMPDDHPELPFVGMDSIEAHTMRLLGTVPSSMMKSASIHFRPGDILYGRLRPYLNKVFAPDFEGLASAEFIPLAAPGGIVPRFLQYRLNAADFVYYASHLDEGDRPRVDYDQIGAFRIELPPSDEQHRIVSVIESYFTRLDDAVATLERVQRNLKRYRASVLKAAVEGRLVPTEAELARAEGRSYEPASVLLERILAERRRRWEDAELAKMTAKGKVPKDDKWKAKYAEPVAPDTSELPELPEGWCWATLDTTCDSVTDGDHLPPPQSEDGVPFLVIGNVAKGRIDFDDTRFVPEDYFSAIDIKRRPGPGDILYTVTGTFGIPVLVETDRRFCVQRHIAILRAAQGINRHYLAHALASVHVFRQASNGATGTAQKTVALKVLRAITVPIPPAAEQRRITDEAERLLSMGSATDATVSGNQRRCARLRQSILKWAFEGRLVDQDPTDEPASVLLERIRAERASSNDNPPRRPRRTKVSTNNS